MAVSTSAPSQIITQPKGGGAIQGLGEKFVPDLHTGTGNFSIPLTLPAGRNGFTPELSLQYSTGHGNGPFGFGWNLATPAITRRTAKGVPRYNDLQDTFVLAGADDLVPVEQTAGHTRYQPRTEGSFTRVTHVNDATGNYWTIETRDGRVTTCGTPTPANSPPSWRDPAALVDPANHEHVFMWRISLTSDPCGNRIEYSYERDPIQTEGAHNWDQLYLSRVRYLDHGARANPDYLIETRFAYELRPDPFSEYRSGFEIRTIRRCNSVEIASTPGRRILVRTYHLDYLDQRPELAVDRSLNSASLLSRIRVEGHDGASSELLPPLECRYTTFKPEDRKFSPVEGDALPARSLANPQYELVDLFGNGLPDLLEMDGTIRYWRNRGEGTYDEPRQMNNGPAGLRLSDAGVQLLDANGDGRVELLVSTGLQSGYYPLSRDGGWDATSFQSYRVAPSFDLKDPEVRLVDLDGNGVTDVIRSAARLECFFNDPIDGWGEARFVARQSLDTFPDVNFSDPRVRWADISGDSLQDVVLIYDGNVEYLPSLGRGRWGPAHLNAQRSPVPRRLRSAAHPSRRRRR